MRFTLRQLQIFVAVAQHESVSRAAESLALSQSAASTALTELERQTDCQLFDRAGKRVSLNALGHQLLPQAMALIHQAKAIENLLDGRSSFGSLAVGATLTIGNYLATLLIGSFMQRHPECRVKLQVQNTANVVQQVAHYELDLGLIEGDCRHPDIEVQPWVEDELVVFCAPSHPLASRGRASLAELTAEAWILRESGSGTRLTFEQALRSHLAELNVRLELEHTEAIKRAVESGLGIGCISRLALRDAFRRGSLVALETPDLDLRRQFYFIWHRQKYQTAAMQEFLAQCRELTAGVAQQDQRPDHGDHAQRDELGGAAHVLGIPGQRVALQGNPVDHRLDRRIEQLDDQRQQAHGYQQRAFAAADAEDEAQGNEDQIEQHQLTERRFTAKRREQPGAGIAGGVEHTFEADLPFVR